MANFYDPRRDTTPYQIFAEQLRLNRMEEEKEDAQTTKNIIEGGKLAFGVLGGIERGQRAKAQEMFNILDPGYEGGRKYEFVDTPKVKKGDILGWLKNKYRPASERVREVGTMTDEWWDEKAKQIQLETADEQKIFEKKLAEDAQRKAKKAEEMESFKILEPEVIEKAKADKIAEMWGKDGELSVDRGVEIGGETAWFQLNQPLGKVAAPALDPFTGTPDPFGQGDAAVRLGNLEKQEIDLLEQAQKDIESYQVPKNQQLPSSVGVPVKDIRNITDPNEGLVPDTIVPRVAYDKSYLDEIDYIPQEKVIAGSGAPSPKKSVDDLMKARSIVDPSDPAYKTITKEIESLQGADAGKIIDTTKEIPTGVDIGSVQNQANEIYQMAAIDVIGEDRSELPSFAENFMSEEKFNTMPDIDIVSGTDLASVGEAPTTEIATAAGEDIATASKFAKAGDLMGKAGTAMSIYKAGSTLLDDDLSVEQKAIRTAGTVADLASTKAIQAGLATANPALLVAGGAWKAADMLGVTDFLEDRFG